MQKKLLNDYKAAKAERKAATKKVAMSFNEFSKEAAKDSSNDALIIKAAELYCKWQYDFNSKGDRYEKAYLNLRDAISLCDTYIAGSEQANV